MSASSPQIILASQSQSRWMLLKQAGVQNLRQVPSHIDEDELKKNFQEKNFQEKNFQEKNFRGDFEDLALELAQAKAEKISKDYADAWIIAADQILVFENQCFDKARSIEEARANFKLFRGKSHDLLGGHIVMRHNRVKWRHLSKARLTMRDFSDSFLDDYISHMGDNLLKAVGGYQLEGQAVQLFSAIQGDYFSVLGLDLLALLEALRQEGAISK